MLGNIFILGDSYSTFTGYIPDGYRAYYTPQGPYYIAENSDLKLEKEQVCKVEQTWWYNLSKDYGVLIRNCSWSGTLCKDIPELKRLVFVIAFRFVQVDFLKPLV